MKKYIVVLLLFPLFSQGQNNPGYMGKKFIIGYGLNFAPSIVANFSFNENERKNAPISTKNGLDLEYAVHKKYSLVFGMDYFSTSIGEDYNGDIEINGNYIDYSSLENSKISSTGFSFGLKSYQKHLAPLGTNWEYRFLYRTSNVADLLTTIDSLNIMGSNFVQFGFGVGYNVNRIIWDQIVLSIGINANIHFSLDEDLGELYLESTSNSSLESQSNTFKFRAASRVNIREIFYFKVGLGYLF